MTAPTELRRATIYVEDAGDEPAPEYKWVQQWLARWGGRVHVADYSTGGWEHLWDVEGPAEAIAEVPDELLRTSDWTMQPRRGPRGRQRRRHPRR